MDQERRLYGLLVETFREKSRISRPRVRPVAAEFNHFRLNFPKHLREEHPIGTRFRCNAKIVQKTFPGGAPDGRPHLTASPKSIKLESEPNSLFFEWAIKQPGSISDRAHYYITTPGNKLLRFKELKRLFASFGDRLSEDLSGPDVVRRWEEKSQRYAELRSGGDCELCKDPVLYFTEEDSLFLQVHHVEAVNARDKFDPNKFLVVCPSCLDKIKEGKVGGPTIQQALDQIRNKYAFQAI